MKRQERLLENHNHSRWEPVGKLRVLRDTIGYGGEQHWFSWSRAHVRHRVTKGE